MSSNVELCLLTIRETFVYRVPPARASTGPQCATWGLEKPIWSGGIKLYEKSESLYLRFVSSEGTLFCESQHVPIKKIDYGTMSPFLQAATDSSRYFVVRVAHPKTGAIMALGFGFEARSEALDLLAVIKDKVKLATRIGGSRNSEDEARKAEEEAIRKLEEFSLGKDLSLSGDKKISVKIKGMKSTNKKKSASSGGSSSSKPFKLAPPPSEKEDNNNTSAKTTSFSGLEDFGFDAFQSASTSHSSTGANATSGTANRIDPYAEVDEDEWGDFQ